MRAQSQSDITCACSCWNWTTRSNKDPHRHPRNTRTEATSTGVGAGLGLQLPHVGSAVLYLALQIETTCCVQLLLQIGIWTPWFSMNLWDHFQTLA